MGYWSEAKKKKIRDSRIQGTRLLCHALSQLQKPPQVLVSASAVGYYGNRDEELLNEEKGRGEGFLAEVCEAWENATRTAMKSGVRVVNLRLGMVLSPKGGALKKMLLPFKLGLGGQIGSGRQKMSWIAIDDLLYLIAEALSNPRLEGPVNAVSPHAVTNREWTKILGLVLKRPTLLAMPTFLVKWACGQLGEELLLSSANAKPEKLEKVNFHFSYPYLEEALRHVLGQTV